MPATAEEISAAANQYTTSMLRIDTLTTERDGLRTQRDSLVARTQVLTDAIQSERNNRDALRAALKTLVNQP